MTSVKDVCTFVHSDSDPFVLIRVSKRVHLLVWEHAFGHRRAPRVERKGKFLAHVSAAGTFSCLLSLPNYMGNSGSYPAAMARGVRWELDLLARSNYMGIPG